MKINMVMTNDIYIYIYIYHILKVIFSQKSIILINGDILSLFFDNTT